MEYDLNRLGDRDFEHVVRALLIKVAGYGVQAFGVGADGGREAAFEGRFVPPLRADEPWEGYGVLQAKFRVFPDKPDQNLKWLRDEQLTPEFKSWLDPKSKRRMRGRMPDYLIIATNVRLSSGAGGGIDAINNFMDLQVGALGLKGWVLWEYNTICRLLDDAPGIAQRYAGSITSGDVLAGMLEALARLAPSFSASASAQVEKELLAKQWVRLSETGHAGDGRLTLGDVAVDLPAQIHGDDGIEHVKVVEHILESGNVILRPSHQPQRSGGFVIVGGPGQGKSTLGRLLCQTYQVAMLAERTYLSKPAARLRDEFLRSLPQIGLSAIPTVRRWPMLVPLSAYADKLAENEDLQLLDFIVNRVKETEPVTRDMMKAWLHSWPWLLVLDGLDEVADRNARERLLEKLSQFEVDATDADADVLLVVTTRPQGYTPEEPLSAYTHVRLRVLDIDEAVSFADRLVGARHPGDADFVAEVLTRLRRESQDDAIAHLMRSPLQVTIMSLLLEQRSRVPRSRYALFEEYYGTVFRRESEKPTPEGRLLEENAKHIHALHSWTGLVLQVRSEQEGEADAMLTSDELGALVARRIRQEDSSACDAAERAQKLIALAEHRLVLLERSGDRFGFEVRSIQEFMAARALVTWERTPAEVLDRLRALVPSAHWRNTWLLAAGSLFDAEQLRADLRILIEEVDTEGLVAARVLPGARLAVDLLEDDVAHSSPNFQNSLAKLALDLLRQPPSRSAVKLARVLFPFAQADGFITKAVHDAATFSSSSGLAAVLILAYWADEQGPAAVAARQRLDVLKEELTPTMKGLAASLAAAYPLAAIRELVPIETARFPAADLASVLSMPEGDLPEALKELKVWQERRGGTVIVRRVDPVLPEIAGLDALLVQADQLVPLLSTLDALPPHEWPLVAQLYRIFREWLQRQPVGDRIKHPAIVPSHSL